MDSKDGEKKFLRTLATKERRTVEAEEDKEPEDWRGVEKFGMVGWSITAPVLVGLLLGWVLDRLTGHHHLWVTVFFFIGLIGGCATTVYWLFAEYRQIEEEPPHKHE